jgi:aryl-alcohol dehydrogenase-like predicted oxidoreductase/choline dehydrogenase-like flavoprotein
MLHDFETMDSSALPSRDNRANVCIVGAGAAGILLATELAKKGISVILLEGGGLNQEARSQDLYRTELSGLPYPGATRGRFRTYGGSTTQWGGQIMELEDHDFEAKSHIKGSGWPLKKADLAPFYERALIFEGLRLCERDDAKVWEGLGLSPLDLGPEFHMQYSRWCPERDFATLKSRPLTESRYIKVFYHANATGFVLNDSRSKIEAVCVRSYSGRLEQITADRYIVCIGGIETNRLLLQPTDNGMAPWQTNDLLGKHYHDHVSLNLIAVRDITAQPASRYFGYATLSGFRYHNKILLCLDEQTRLRVLNVAATIGPFEKPNPRRDDASVMIREVFRKGRRPTVGEWVSAIRHFPSIARNAIAQRFDNRDTNWNCTMLTVHCEQEPRSASSIVLNEQRDAIGMLRAKLDWRISNLEIHTLRSYVKLGSEVFADRRFARVIPPAGFFEDDGLVRSICSDSNHHMGGTPMAPSAREGIVDTNLKLHGIENGYLCSSSVFPTGGFSNPSHTLLALAMRLSDHLREKVVGEQVWLPEPIAASYPMRSVALRVPAVSHLFKAVPQLGFGCSYLLRPGLNRDRSLRLLEAAYDAGIRHFDTARLYGQGECEVLLGQFLRTKPDATVTTKFGLEPPNFCQRIMTAAGRRISSLREPASFIRGDGKAVFNAKSARASMERSLRALGREHVELFLLHEPECTDLVHDDLLHFLQDARAAGKIGNFGIGGDFSRVAGLYGTRRAYAPVLQFEHSVFSPKLNIPKAQRIHFRTFSRPAAALAEAFVQDKSTGWWWSEMVGADLQEPEVLCRILLRASLDQEHNALTLFSTSSEEHIYENVLVAQDSNLAEQALRLKRLIQETDLGIGKSLYQSID